MSILATQLAKNASLNADLLLSRRKITESYLFTGREADRHDLESIHALGVNGLLQLASINPAISSYEDILFSNAVKVVDRTLLSVEANAELNTHLRKFLPMLGPYLMDAPTGKVIEWLVRRFRVNEFNVQDVLSLFWPYHESPHFAKMLTILHIGEQSIWRFLLAHKAAAQSIPRFSLVSEMLKNTDVARFITALLPTALQGGYTHRTLLAFNAASLHDFIIRSKSLDEGTVAFLLPALLEPLQKYRTDVDVPKDAILGSYVLLSTLSQKCHISPKALKTIISAMANCAHRVTTQQFISAAISVCEPQDELDNFTNTTVKSLTRLSGIHDEICSALVWSGVEKFIGSMVSGIVSRLHEVEASSFLESILVSPKIPESIVQRITTSLMDKIIGQDSSISHEPAARRLLSMIYQRYPSIVRNTGNSGEFASDAVQELLLSLSMVDRHENESTDTHSTLDTILASASIEPASRKVAVLALISILTANANQEASEKDSIHSALLARVCDTDTQVLEALYDNSPVISQVFATNLGTYLDGLQASLCNPASKTSRSILRVHLNFLILKFCPKVKTDIQFEVFRRILFPLLLFSKPRQRAADLVWEILASDEQHEQIPGFELLAGCTDTWRKEKAKTHSSPLDLMSGLNSALAYRVAENILVSNHHSRHLDFLIEKLGDINTHARSFGYLIMLALLGRLSGKNQLDAAVQVLQVMKLDQAAETATSFANDLVDSEHMADLAKHVVLKPSSLRTLHRLQISILALVANIPDATGAMRDWLANPHSEVAPGNVDNYVYIMRTVYRLSHVSNSHSLKLLRVLFDNLETDTLAFLAGIWTSSTDRELRVAAVRHAAAFLQAHCSIQNLLDFQTVLPSLIVALQTLDGEGREAVLECISYMVIPTAMRFSAVYGLDSIYGEGSATLQFLNQHDYQRYVSSLVECKTHLLADPGYIYVFHRQHLEKVKTDKKKDATYKDRVLCYLLSHINSVSSPDVQMRLLNLVDDISDSLKAPLLLPLAQELVDKSHSEELAARFGPNLESIAASVVSSFDHSIAGSLNEEDSRLWPVFVRSLRCYFKTGSLSSPRNTIMDNLKNGLFTMLTFQRKAEVSNLLLDIGSRDVGMYLESKQLLASLLEDVHLVVHLLKCHQPPLAEDSPRANKRTKTTEMTESTADFLTSLTLLVEVLGISPVPASLGLIPHLLETLHRVVQHALSSQTDLSFIQQLLMSAVEDAAEKVTEVPNLMPSAIRLDILVDLIRAASNPQIFNQALLLMASLSRLAPESVLHNVMPVFTFMGSNVFHRDDAYSFRVVQKTIDSIIPVMVTSFKNTHSDRLALYVGARDFLRIFTDAASHIPRHRRTKFFAHLVDVLGPQDFLAPLLMLLVEKPTNRIVRQNSEEVKNTLSLHLSILQHYPTSVQIFTCAEFLRESLRLASRVYDPKNVQTTFLDISRDEHLSSTSTALKRLAQSLIILVGNAINSSTVSSEAGSNGEALGELVTLLIDIATVQGVPNPDKNDIAKTTRSSMNSVLGVMPAAHFVRAVQTMLECSDDKVQAAAFDLLSEHLPRISTKTRQEVSPTVEKILGSIHKLISSHHDGPLAAAAFKSLKTICVTTSSGEESSLTNFIPILLLVIKREKMVEPAIAVLPPLVIRLGPRLIPHLRDIISQCVIVLQRTDAENTLVIQDTLNVLHNLLRSIPTFWTTMQLTQVIQLYLDLCQSPSTKHTMSSLMKAIAKHAPKKILLSAMTELWCAVTQNTKTDVFVDYFDLLKKGLHGAPRAVVLEQLRPLFNVILEALEVISSPAETQAISAFLEIATKLNEASFKPIFRRLYDWAFANRKEQANTRQIAFCHVYRDLLDYFKGLMTPYMSFLLNTFTEILATNSPQDHELWFSVLQCLSLSLQHDDGAFWRDDKLRQITPVLIKQVAVCVRLDISDGKKLLLDCLNALTERVDDDTLLKTINLDILIYTRSEDSQLRIFALSCSESLWRTHGGKLLGFVAETTSFMAECAEDENDSVVKQSHQLKNAVENVAGNIDGLMI